MRISGKQIMPSIAGSGLTYSQYKINLLLKSDSGLNVSPSGLSLESLYATSSVYGSTNSIPVITVDKYGRISGITTSYIPTFSLTTNGNSGASTYDGSTLNVPEYTLNGLTGVQPPNTVLAGSSSGTASSYPTFRALVKGDIPNIVFASDILVSLSGGKTVGKYVSGQTIPSAGRTAEEVFNLISQEALAPTVSLTSPTTIQFNQTSINNVLNFSYTINSLGASVSTVSLEWRRNNTGAWTVLTTNTSLITYTHVFTDTNFNTQPFNYRYIVTDTSGGSFTATTNITPAAYVPPTITFSAPPSSTLSPETNTIRERGNTTSNLQGSTSRNSALVNILSYQFAVSVNAGAFINVGSSVALGASGGSFTTTPDTTNSATTTTATYRVTVTDQFTTTSTTYVITYKYIMFYGEINVATPLDSAAIRSLSRRFVDAGSPFTFPSGTTNRRFIVAMDTSKTLTQALDTNNNVDLTSVFINNPFNVNDAGGNPVAYKNYVYTNSLPYSSSITIRITYV